MPERETVERARRDLRRGESPSTAAGEFVREEMHHIREGKHGAASTKQAIAIGLSKARRAGVPLKPQARGGTKRSRTSEAQAYAAGQHTRKHTPSRRRSKATRRALKRKGHRAASRRALSAQARRTARMRGKAARKAAAQKAARTRRRHVA